MAVALGRDFDDVLAGARSGEAWALEAVYRDLYWPVLGYLRGLVAEEAEDLASDVFVAVAASIRRFRGDETAFRSWVFTIAHRRVAGFHRRALSRRSPRSEAVRSSMALTTGDVEEEALHSLEAREVLERIRALTRDQAEVVLLRVVGDLSVEDVAAIVRKRPGAVRALQHRANLRLARDLRKRP